MLPENSIIACGPVIIEDGKVLLNREMKEYGESPYFMFPGGKVENFDDPLEHTAIREAKEELNIDIEIIKPLRTLAAPRLHDKSRYAILVHYLAKRSGEITLGEDIIEYGWYDIHNLPENAAPNVKEIIDDYIKDNS